MVLGGITRIAAVTAVTSNALNAHGKPKLISEKVRQSQLKFKLVFVLVPAVEVEEGWFSSLRSLGINNHTTRMQDE